MLGNAYLITDRLIDAEDLTLTTTDARGIESLRIYDVLGRTLRSFEAITLPEERLTEMDYDDASNVVETRSPRHFAEDDTNGDPIRAVDTFTYNGRNLRASHTAAVGHSTLEATQSWTYYLDGRSNEHTDFQSNVLKRIWHACCGRLQAVIDKDGQSTTVGDNVVDNDGDGGVVDTAFLAALLGKDIALRIDGAGSHDIIDNVQVTISTPPTLASSDIVDDAAGGPVLENSLVNFTLTFSKDIDSATVEAADFGNAGTAPVTIGAIIETSLGVFSVEATPTASGSLQLQVNAAAVITDTAGNPLDTTAAIADDTTITVLSQFESWAGGTTTFSTDANNDGVADGLAWLWGANAPSDNVQSLKPQVNSNSGGDLIMTFKCLNAANRGSAVISIQYSQDLGVTDLWTSHTTVIPESSGTVNGVIFMITPNGNINEVQATIPAGAPGSSLFGRILGDMPDP